MSFDLRDAEPPNNEPSEFQAHANRSRASGIFIATALCGAVVIALLGQGFGLRSLVQFGTERDTWNAEKRQQEAIRSQWNSLIQEYKQDASSHERERSDLTKAIAALKAEKNRIEEGFADLKASYDDYVKARDQAIADKEAANRDVTKAKDMLATLVTDIGKLEPELTRLQQEKTSLESEVERQNSDHKKVKEQLDTIRNERDKDQKQLVSLTEDLVSMGEQARRLRAETNKLQQDRMAEAERLLQRKQEMMSLDERANKLRNIDEQLITTGAALKAKISELEKAKQDVADERARLENALELIPLKRREFEKLNADIGAALADAESAKKEAKAVKVSIGNLQLEGDKLNKQIETLTNLKRSLDVELDSLAKQIESKDELLKRLREREVTVSKTLDDLTKRATEDLEKAKKKLDEKPKELPEATPPSVDESEEDTVNR